MWALRLLCSLMRAGTSSVSSLPSRTTTSPLMTDKSTCMHRHVFTCEDPKFPALVGLIHGIFRCTTGSSWSGHETCATERLIARAIPLQPAFWAALTIFCPWYANIVTLGGCLAAQTGKGPSDSSSSRCHVHLISPGGTEDERADYVMLSARECQVVGAERHEICREAGGQLSNIRAAQVLGPTLNRQPQCIPCGQCCNKLKQCVTIAARVFLEPTPQTGGLCLLILHERRQKQMSALIFVKMQHRP